MDNSQEKPAGSLVVFNMDKINFIININQKSLCLKTNQISSKKIKSKNIHYPPALC